MGRFFGPGKQKPRASTSKDYDPQYPTDLSDPDWHKKLPKHNQYITVTRMSIPCINWMNNNPFDFLKPDTPPKPKKIKPVKKGRGPWESPWDPKSPSPYSDPKTQPWDTSADPYKYPNWKDGDEYTKK